VGVFAFVAFNANGREIGSYDTQSSKFLAVEIAKRGTLSLGHVVGRMPLLAGRPAFARDRHGNYRSAYPLPSPLAASVIAWVLSASRLVDLDAPLGANLIAKLTASSLTALAVAWAFLAAAMRTSPRNAVLVALGFGLGTNLWASVSQTLWQQETALCALMGAIALLRDSSSTVRLATAGALLGLAGWARPQLAPTVAVLSLSMLARAGWRSAAGVIPVLGAAALAIGVNLAWFGHPLGALPALESLHPAVHGVAGSFEIRPWLSAMALLVSPSRGLLIFSPIVVLAAAGLNRARQEGWRSDMPWSLAAAAAQFVFYCFYKVWWGGHTFGPRYALDVLPPLVPLAAAGLNGVMPSRPLRLAAAVCLAWSVVVAGLGAFVYPVEQWNSLPVDVDLHHERLWDWQDSQIPRALRAGWNPQNFGLFSEDAFRRPARQARGQLHVFDRDIRDSGILPASFRLERNTLAAPVRRQPLPPTTSFTITSPDRRIKFELDQQPHDRLAYRVTMKGRAVIERSRLGIVVDGVNLADDAAIGTIERTHQDQRYPTRGVHAIATNRYNGASVGVTHEHSGSRYTIDVRVFDDGVAFRYVVPGAATAQRTPDEATLFNFPAGSTVWYHDLDGHYEGVHEKKDVEDVEEGEWAAPPLTARLPEGLGYASVTEAGLVNYAGMALQADRRGGFAARLGHAVPASYPYRLRYPALDVRRLEQPATITGTITTPWRVVLIGSDLNTLVNSDIITSLSPPPDPALFPQGIDTPWVKPGRAVWRYLDGGENTFDGIKQFSELAGKLGFEYQVVEGLWRRWTDDQLRELVSFSNERHVGLLLWVHSRDLHDGATRQTLFEKLHAFGIAGVKVDFFDHEAKEVIDLYHDILRETAENHLLCDFHGANKPAGESRTWPNEMTREGVYGFEHRAQSWAAHNTTLPFTRYLAGHGDYTPVVFGDRRKETSWPHQIATAAIFTSPLLVYGGHPQSLLDNPAVDLIKALPSTWDETVVLPGSGIGEAAVFARRRGAEWFIAVLNGPDARTMRLDLKFLGPATYRATLVRDDPDAAAAERVERASLSRQRSLTITMRAGGGFIARLVPVKGGGS